MRGLAAGLALAGTLAFPALAQDELLFFRTPSGNIHCMIDSGGFAGVRCDILSFAPSFTGRPADCDLDWGDSFWIGPGDRRGTLFCHGDTVMSPDAAELGYGGSIAKSGLRCQSERTGLTCTNEAGHGFFLSKAGQRVF